MSDQDISAPRHIGFIVDGNRRWAKSQGKPPQFGHRAGAEQLKTIAKAVNRRGIEFASAYIFSTENWKRAEEEVSFLMDLTIKLVERDLDELHQEGIRLVHLGSRENVPGKVMSAIDRAVEKTKDNPGMVFGLCFNYGGQQEIVDAVKKFAEHNDIKNLTIESLQQNLYGGEVIPPLDFVVRTSGEERISNFMLWRTAYAEFYWAQVNWPEFTEEELDKALKSYSDRQRRFGA